MTTTDDAPTAQGMDPPFSSILVSGPDARPFLQGQLSCDIKGVNREQPLLGALNSPQGRVQAVVWLSEREDGIALSVITPMAEKTLDRLRKYVLRSKVKIEMADASLLASARSPAIGALLSQLRAGIPHVFPETHEAFVAQMLNLDLLGAISFNKGCYTGQEIIARTHYRGSIKRRMFRFAAHCTPPTPGTRIVAGTEHAGDVVYAADTDDGCELLAVISLAQIEATLAIDSIPLRIMPLPYELPKS